MNVEFISNTGAYISHNGFTLGMDLWLTQGAFEGSWYHYPPLRQTKKNVSDCDAIYISHIHPDHCDFNALKTAKPDCTFIVPSYFNDLIKRKLAVFGFHNVVSLSDNESADIDGVFQVTLFGQFVKSLGSKEAQFGSLIDTAILIDWDGRTILNCNDNYLNAEEAQKLKMRYPNIDYAMMPHSASGPYPACFLNLSQKERYTEANRLQEEYVSLFVETTAILAPRYVSPTAAEYVIVGEKFNRNDQIGLASSEMAVNAWCKYKTDTGHSTDIKQLDCGTILNIDTGEVSGLPIRNFSMEEKIEFASQFKSITFRYQWEDSCSDEEEMPKLLEASRSNLWQVQTRLDWFMDYNFILRIDNRSAYCFNFDNPKIQKVDPFDFSSLGRYVLADVSTQLIYSIMKGNVHWNNAEGGLHIDFYREPNIFVPEVYVLMSFFRA